jgi:cbb3-type cytochrome oxidase subunit 3
MTTLITALIIFAVFCILFWGVIIYLMRDTHKSSIDYIKNYNKHYGGKDGKTKKD